LAVYFRDLGEQNQQVLSGINVRRSWSFVWRNLWLYLRAVYISK